MRKMNLLPCLLLAFCMMLVSCTPKQTAINNTPAASEVPTEEVTASPTPVITARPTEEPTEEPTAWLDKANLNEHDYNAVRAFLEIEDENGVKNGEKLNCEVKNEGPLNKSYDPDDPKTWGRNRPNEPHPEYDKDCPDFVSWLCFDWTADGRLYSVYLYNGLEGTVLASEKLVGKLDLSGCTGLHCVRITGQDITSLDVTDCAMPVVRIVSCPEIELIESGDLKLTSLSIFDSSKLKKIRWLSPEWTYEDIGYYESDDTPMTKEADITLEAGDGGIVELRDFDDWDTMGASKFAIAATPQEGHKFLGWYDTNGKLISKDSSIPIFVNGIDKNKVEKISLLELVGSNEIHLIAKFK